MVNVLGCDARAESSQPTCSVPDHSCTRRLWLPSGAIGNLLFMARRGVWELRNLTIRYSSAGGSSRGVREYVEKDLLGFAKKNPQISIETILQSGHPAVCADYGKMSCSRALRAEFAPSIVKCLEGLTRYFFVQCEHLLVTGYSKSLGLKNLDKENVASRIQYLRDTLGQKTPKHGQMGFVQRKHVSVQGFWRNTADLRLCPLPEQVELRERRQREHGFEKMVNEYGLAGIVMITKKLLERQEAAKAAALAKEPKVEKVHATE